MSLKQIWKEACVDKKFAYETIGAFLFLVVVMFIFSRFVQFVEMREGSRIVDPILNSFNAIDLTWPIFMMIYGAIIFAVYILLFSPQQLTLLFEAYGLMVLMRIVLMYIVPLDPPFGMIILQDPFVEFFGGNKTLTKDLFFSGHTASLFLLYLAVPKNVKGYFLILTILVAVGVLLQKVHYTIDVLVAPFISFVCYYLASRIRQKLIHI